MAYPYDENGGQTPPPYGNENRFENEYLNRNNAFDSDPASGKSRGVAALLAIFLGGFGVQYFYLGKTTAGLLTILITICTCGAWEILTFIQGILMLCMDNRSFLQKYVYTQSSFPLF
ncbi:MAG: TM2 domain-containing protein [Bacteroides sp.]|nr:TM2 domain-containing protein [Bacteroidales bacterium]MBD5251233.1 TM2 domain-containing protein [Barnesiella sp.]MBD5254411.1 TM2 domain-containing protein [Barnesiella sp.]MBD5343522.1 TM2 domain-containing protein [Bacteroides sp.]MBD5368087.1 TM2 domain-containing protein [Bacteroides sp.]